MAKNHPNSAIRAIGYARVSTLEQAEEGISLQVQEDSIRAYAKLHGLELTDILSDRGESGKDPDPGRPRDAPVADSLDVVLIRDVRGAVLDTLARVPTSQTFRFSGDAPEWHSWAAYPDFDLTWRGGLVTGSSDSYRLKWYDENGDLERIVSLPRERQPITDRDRSLLMEKIERMLREWDMSPAEIAQWKSAVHFEGSYPAWRRFICGVNGTLWLQRPRPVRALSEQELEDMGLGRPPATSEWDVFDREGRYLGVMDMPTGEMAFMFAGDRIYGVWEDELDVQYIVAWRIDGLPSPEEG